MPVQQEVEVKFVLHDPGATRQALLDRGAQSKGIHYEMNARLDDSIQSLRRQGTVLRIRRMEKDGKTDHILTVKTPITDFDPLFGARNEFEFTADDGEALMLSYQALGYSPYWRYEKRRETLIFDDGLEVVLDEMPFGWFMEVEGSPELIRALADYLGLHMEDGITVSYAVICENVCRRLGIEMADLTFEAFAGVEVPPDAYLYS